MSNHTSQRYSRSEDLKLLLSNTNIRESPHPYQFQWMAHWAQESSSSSTQILKNCAVSNVGNNEACIKGQGYLPIESMTSKDVKLLSVDMNPSHPIERKNVWRSDLGKRDLTSYVLKSAEAAGNEKGRFNNINNSIVRRTVNSFGAEALDKLSVQKLPASSVNWENFTTNHSQNSQSVSSEQMHFPMFDINRKMETILARKRKSSYGTMAVRMNELQLLQSEYTLAPHAIEFASVERQCQPQSMIQSTDQVMEPYESIRGLAPYLDDHTGSDSHAAVHRCKCHRPNMTACLCAEEENDPSSSELAYKEQFADTNLTHLKHELCKSSSKSSLMVSEMKNENEMLVRRFGNSWPTLKDGSMQVFEDSCPGNIPQPLLTGERGREIEYVSCSRPLPRHKTILELSKPNDSECVLHRSHKMPNCSINDEGALAIDSTLNFVDSRKGGHQKFSNAAQYLLITKKMGMNLCHEDQMIGDSTISATVNGTAFLEMLTLPTRLQNHGQQVEKLQPLVSSTTRIDQEESNGIDTPIMEKQNESSVKTDTMYIDVSQAPSSLPGRTSSKSQKGVVCPNLTRSESTAASPIRQAISRNGGTDRSLEHPTLGSNKELSMSRTETMGADHILSHIGEPENSVSNPPMESTIDSNPSNRWVKRLRHHTPDFLALGTKRIKMGDTSSAVGQVQNLFNRVVSCNKSISDLPKCQQFDKTKSLLKNDECSSGDSAKVIHWIRRWCHGRQQSTPPPPVLCEPESSKVLPEKLEGKQFPSIAAMAMMGKTMKNFRPCSFQRKRSSIVWNN